MVSPKMRRRSAWPGLPEVVRQAFVDFEAIVSEVVERVITWAKPKWTVVHTSTNYQAQPWELVTAHEACTILFPRPSTENAGTEIAVTRVTSGDVTLMPLSGRINGFTSVTAVESRVRVYISTGEGWYGIA